MREIRKHGVTRHIICIRHGQYDETHKVSVEGTVLPRLLSQHNPARSITRLDEIQFQFFFFNIIIAEPKLFTNRRMANEF